MAYAAAVSLLQTLRQLQLSDDPFSNTPTSCSRSQIEALNNGVSSLKRFLDDNRDVKSDFEIQIRDAIYEAEEIVEKSSHPLLSEAEISSRGFCHDLESVIQKINSSAKMTAEKFNHLTLDRQINISSWRRFVRNEENPPIFGRDKEIFQLKDRLINGSNSLKVVTIVGNPGIGKTALAQCVFLDPSVEKHFDYGGWARVPVEYHKRDVLLDLLGPTGERHGELCQKTDDQLAEHLYISLKHKRYLVVLDDIRDDVVWNDLKKLFPDPKNGSRLLLTTRDVDLACIINGSQAAPPKSLDLPKGLRSLHKRYHHRKKNPMVGRYRDLIQLKYRLVTGSASLEVVPIVGIPGIGKTILAGCVYDDKCIKGHFGICGWVRVPIEYCKRDVLLGLLESMGKRGDGLRQKTDEQLAKYLYKILKHQRYLVVLDDIRHPAVWNDLKESFPDYNNESRIMLTTRNVDVAHSIGGPPYPLHAMGVEETFTLLRQTIISYASCPPQLRHIAQDIANSCRGFPIAVVTIGKLLSCGSPTEEYWEMVRSSINTCETNDELIERVLYLSYKNLPQYLKACILYMAMFPYDYEIPNSKLIKLWIAEGFIETRYRYTTLEEMAQECLVQLEDRGLISIDEMNKSCKLAEVFYDFILGKAKEEKLFLVINRNTNYGFLQENNTNQLRRLSINKNIRYFIRDLSVCNSSMASASATRSLLYMGPQHQYLLQDWLDFKLLKVLDALKIHFYNFPDEVLKLVQLRYLALSYNRQLPPEVCKLRNLQFLIVLCDLNVKHAGYPSYLPEGIWKMKELRHLQVMGSDLPDPLSETDLLENLSTLSDVSPHSCTRQILGRIPNLKKLGIQIESSLEDETSLSFFSHLDVLSKLESFKCVVLYPDLGSHQVVPCSIPAFPPSLRKLTLSGCGFPWEYMRVIDELPNLEVLKLKSYAFQGPKREATISKFFKLKFLLLEDMDLKDMNLADELCLPKLECLIVRHCYKLQEIPLAFVDSSALEMIEVEDCSVSVVNSALQMREEKLELEMEDLQIELYSSMDD